MNFLEKTAIITGGASGMGAATVRLFSAAGGRAILVDKNAELAQQMAAETGAIAMIGDVSDSAFCNQVIEAAVTHFGKLDILINAAGVIVRSNGVGTSDDQWHRIMNVNVSGTFFMCRAAIQQMLTQRQGASATRGSIVNFGSIWGDLGAAGVAAYCASKGAVHNLTRALALDHAQDGIRINAVCPGEVNTPMIQSERAEAVTPELMDRLAQSVPMGRLADPAEIARVALFIASDEASYMTGSLVNVDAGFTAR
ncbi:MAG: meso-butanediol dehydrogenase/(S,S)-butanediol dehydrogenase/diacetyl reductase [Candidatus Promineifilaceae bacterium]|jgi:meso-butanediol dehydrogenase/(S,S)-butanediol dehydrogenase/diacetyl reductase